MTPENIWEALREITRLEAKLRALESPQSKGRECWVLYHRDSPSSVYETAPSDLSKELGYGWSWVRMVEAPSKGDGEPSPADEALKNLLAHLDLCTPTPHVEEIEVTAELMTLMEDARYVLQSLQARSAPNPSSGEGSQSPSRNTQDTPETP
jgi:hypothetical protein